MRHDFTIMKVDFRDICGKSYNLEIPNNANVADACKYLSQKTGIQENKIFLVSTNSNLNFYQDNEQMIDILKENPEYIIFMKAFINDQNQMNSTLERFENQEATNQDFEQNSNQVPNDITYSQQNLIGKREQILNKSLKFPQKSFFNAIQSAKNWRYNDLYDDYSYVVNEVPHDIQFKVEQLAELGYHIEDIKEALRATNYKVSLAIHFLTLPMTIIMTIILMIAISMIQKMKMMIVILNTLIMLSMTMSKHQMKKLITMQIQMKKLMTMRFIMKKLANKIILLKKLNSTQILMKKQTTFQNPQKKLMIQKISMEKVMKNKM